MLRYLPKYLLMYAVLAAVFAVVSGMIRFPSTLGMLIPALLAALIGQGYVRDHLQMPTTHDRVEFATYAALAGAVISGVLLWGAVQVRLAGSGAEYPPSGELGIRALVLMAAVTLVITWPMVFFGARLGAANLLRQFAAPDSPPAAAKDQPAG